MVILKKMLPLKTDVPINTMEYLYFIFHFMNHSSNKFKKFFQFKNCKIVIRIKMVA